MRDNDFDNSDNSNEGGSQLAIDKLIDSIEENTLTVRDAALTNSIMETGFTNSLKKTTDSILDLSKVLKDTAAEQRKISDKQDKGKESDKGKTSEEKLNSMNATLSQMLKIMSSEYDLQKKIEDRELRGKERGKGVYKAKDNTKPTPMNKMATSGSGGGSGLIGGLSRMLGLGGLLPMLTGMMKKILFAPFKLLGKVVKSGAKLVTPLVSKIFSPITKLLGNIGGKLLSKLTGVFGKMGGGGIGKIFSKLFSKLPMLAEKALPKLLAGLNIVGDIVMALSLIWKYIRGALLDWTKDSPILHKIVTMLDDIIMPISDFFDHLTDLVVGIFTGNGKAVWDNIVKMGKDLLNLVKGVFQPIVDGFNSLTGIVKDWVKNSPVAQNLLKGIEAIFAPIKAVIDWVTEKAGKLAKFLGLDKMVNDAGKKIEAAKKTVVTGVTNVVASVVDVVNEKIVKPVKRAVKMKFQSKEAAANEDKVLQAGRAAGLSGKALANFMGQTKHESANFSTLNEGEYSGARVWDLRGKSLAKRGVTKEQVMSSGKNQLYEYMYADKYRSKENRTGNTQEGDAAKYKGRGFIQLTGKANYAEFSKLTGLDLVNNPELAANPEVAAKIAVAFYKRRGADKLANVGDLTGAREKVNGGVIGLEESNTFTEQYMKKLSATPTADATPDVRKPAAPATPDVRKPAAPATPVDSLTNREKDLAKMRGITDTKVASTSDRGIKFNSAGERIGADIKPVEKPVANVAMENIKEIPKVDKNAQAQTALLSGINNNTAATTISNFGMDELPHSDTLLAAITGRGA